MVEIVTMAAMTPPDMPSVCKMHQCHHCPYLKIDGSKQPADAQDVCRPCCNRCRNTLPFGFVKRPDVLSFSELVIAEASAGALVGGSVSSSVPISSTVGGLLGSSCLSTYLYTWQRVNHSKPHCAHPHNPKLSRNEQTQIIQNHTDVCM